MQSVQVAERALLSVSDVMARTTLGRTAVYGLIQSGQLRSVTVGKHRLIPAEALADWVRSLSDRGAA
jgi:excisionase family DNA binding protein